MSANGEMPRRSNVVLERLLARAEWTPENLGDRLNELARSLNLRARVHRRTPRRWVYAEPGRPAPYLPRDPWPALVCHLLHQRVGEPATLDSLGWTTSGSLTYVPADDGLDQPWDVPGTVATLARWWMLTLWSGDTSSH